MSKLTPKKLPAKVNDSPEPGVEVRKVLRRCALFYRTSGFSDPQLVAEWASALAWASRQRVKAKIYRAGRVDNFRSICERWIRDPKYLNKAGNPLPLPKRGPTSLQSIIAELRLKIDVAQTTSALEKIGSIRRYGRDRYLLVAKMFRCRPDSYVAYETYAAFLAHAVTAATMPLQAAKTDKYSHWLASTKDNLSPTQIKKFIAFVKRRSQPQMLELDDALISYSTTRNATARSRKGNTVGAAMFTFVTEPDSP